jgi:hypothetical protein
MLNRPRLLGLTLCLTAIISSFSFDAEGQTTPVGFTSLATGLVGTPTAPSVGNGNNCGMGTTQGWQYAVVALDAAGGNTTAGTSPTYNSSCSAATLSPTNYIKVGTFAVPGAASCVLYRLQPDPGKVAPSTSIPSFPCGATFYDFTTTGADGTSPPTTSSTGSVNAQGMVGAQAFLAGLNGTGTGAGTEILNSGQALSPCTSTSAPYLFVPCIPLNGSFFQQAPSSFTSSSLGITWPTTFSSATGPFYGPFLLGSILNVTNNAAPVNIGTLTNSSNSNLATATGSFANNDLLVVAPSTADVYDSGKLLSNASISWYAAGTGPAQTQAVVLSPPVPALTPGLEVNWKPLNANTGMGPTLTVNTLAATTIMKCGATALVANDIVPSAIASVIYDGANFELQNPQAVPCSATAINVANASCATTSTGGALCIKEGTAPTSASGTDQLYADSTAHDFIIQSNGGGNGLLQHTIQKVHSTGNTGAISTTTLCAATAGLCNQVGMYTIEWSFIETGTACSAPGVNGGATFLLTWTDFNGTAHSSASLAMQDASSLTATSATFHFQNSLANAWASGTFNISTNGTAIQYATGYTVCASGTGTYELDITVTRKQ